MFFHVSQAGFAAHYAAEKKINCRLSFPCHVLSLRCVLPHLVLQSWGRSRGLECYRSTQPLSYTPSGGGF